MTHRSFAVFSVLAALLASASAASAQTVRLVDVVPHSASAETNRDAEPNIAVNPANPLQIAISAFTPDPGGSANVPLFISSDGGATWALTPNIIAGTVGGCFSPICDITIRFAGSSNLLYASWLNPTGTTQLNVASIANPFSAAPVVTTLEQRFAPPGFPDQPYIAATTVLGGAGTGNDRLYVAVNEYMSPTGKTATIDLTQNAVAPAPAGFSSQIVESRSTTGQDGPSVRPAVAEDGTAYAVFYGNHSGPSTDIVVVRDDAFGAATPPYGNISSGGNAGVFAATNVPMSGSGVLGSQRVGSQAAIAVDPHDSQNVYVAWGDYSGGSYTLHVRNSTTGGASWGSDLQTITGATNPGLAVTYAGTLGFLYQHWGGPSPGTWETHLRTTTDNFATQTDTLLATTPDISPGAGYGGQNTIGDYDSLVAAGKDLYGVFSANNTPDHANFNPALSYPRNANFTTHQVLNLSNVAVQSSVDPFFFSFSPLRPDQDFYVRDWSASPVSHDEGQEPSTNPVFVATSDIWNRNSNTGGTFGVATDQPDHQNPATGTNYAFVRVSRKAAAAPASGNVNVAARILFSDFGLGNPYVDIGTVHLNFAPADTVQTLADGSGLAWSVPGTHSTHGCIGVEITAPNDPYVGELLGTSPGWPPTDLAVLDDNNKAQRNMDLSAVAVDSGPTMHFATVQNAASFTRDVRLAWNAPASVRKLFTIRRLVAIDERGNAQTLPVPAAGSPRIVLARMRPTESRTLAVEVATTGARLGATIPIGFDEVVGTRRINGFVFALRIADVKSVLAEIDRRNLATTSRLAVREIAYRRTPADRVGALERLAADVAKRDASAGQAFALREAIAAARAVANDQRPAAVAAYANAVEAADAYQTSLLKRAGDPANAVQLLILERDAMRRSPKTGAQGRAIAAAADQALREVPRNRKPASVLAAFAVKTAEDAAAVNARLGDRELAEEFRGAIAASADPDAFTAAYRVYLLRLNDLIGG